MTRSTKTYIMRIVLSLVPLLYGSGCVSPAPATRLVPGITTEAQARLAFSRCQVSKVTRPDGTFQLHVWIRSLQSLHILNFSADGVLEGMGGQVTR